MAVRPCLSGCGALTNATRCPACTTTRERARGTSTQRGYGAQWARLSRQVIAEEGACRDCGHTGSPGNPLTADHIVPKARGGGDDRANLTCRCRVHNSARRPNPRSSR